MFKYSSYWRTWSRVLHYQGSQWVEIDLTGVNDNWDRVKTENIRFHNTSLSTSDILQGELPPGIVKGMEAALGGELTEKLLYFNYYPLIDLDKYHKACNGGAAFEKIQK